LDRPRILTKLEQSFVYVDNGGKGGTRRHYDAQVRVKSKSKRQKVEISV